jgi:hypothetical protein
VHVLVCVQMLVVELVSMVCLCLCSSLCLSLVVGSDVDDVLSGVGGEGGRGQRKKFDENSFFEMFGKTRSLKPPAL